MEVLLVEFSLSNNAVRPLGERTQTIDVDTITWTTGGDNRKVQGIDGDTLFRSHDRGANHGQRYLLYAKYPAEGRPNYALTGIQTNFEHIWSAWRGQRWVDVTNEDEGTYSFRDAVEFHKEQVFSEWTTTGTILWESENTVSIVGTLRFKLAPGWSGEFTDDTGFTQTLRSGGDAFQKSNGTLTLNFLQGTVEGATTTYEEGEVTEERRLYDDTLEYESQGEVVQSDSLTFTMVEAESGAEQLFSNYEAGEFEVRTRYFTDNMETTDTDEERWTLQCKYPSGKWYPHGSFSTQEEADAAFTELIERLQNYFTDYNERQTKANEDASSREQYQEVQSQTRVMDIHKWNWYFTNPDEVENPFSNFVLLGEWEETDTEGRVLELTDPKGQGSLLQQAGAVSLTVKENYHVRMRAATATNLLWDRLGVTENEWVEQVTDPTGLGANRGSPYPRKVGDDDIIELDLFGGDSIEFDISSEHDSISDVSITLNGTEITDQSINLTTQQIQLQPGADSLWLSLMLVEGTDPDYTRPTEPTVDPVTDPDPVLNGDGDFDADSILGIAVAILFGIGLLAVVLVGVGRGED